MLLMRGGAVKEEGRGSRGLGERGASAGRRSGKNTVSCIGGDCHTLLPRFGGHGRLMPLPLMLLLCRGAALFSSTPATGQQSLDRFSSIGCEWK